MRFLDDILWLSSPSPDAWLIGIDAVKQTDEWRQRRDQWYAIAMSNSVGRDKADLDASIAKMRELKAWLLENRR